MAPEVMEGKDEQYRPQIPLDGISLQHNGLRT